MTSEAPISWFGQMLGRLIVILLCTVAWFFLSKLYLGLACWAVFFPVALLAWPIWEYQKESRLFRRRVMLAGVSKEESTARRFLWRGSLSKIIQVFVSLAWAIALLAFSYGLTSLHWQIIFLDAVIFALMIPVVEKLLSGQVNKEHLQTVARRWPLFWINIIVLTISLAAVDFFQGVPDTRGLGWVEVVRQAFVIIEPLSECDYSAWCTASASAVTDLSWHLQAWLSDHLSGSFSKTAAWAVFLLKSSVIVLIMTRLFLGVSILFERRSIGKTAMNRGNAFPRLFVFTLMILFVPYLYLTAKKIDTRPIDLIEKVAESNPCAQTTEKTQALTLKIEKQVADQSLAIKSQIDQQIDARIEQLFTGLEPGVDAFLDWYFSVLGEYSILASLVVDDAHEYLLQELQVRLFETVDVDKELAAFNQSLMDQTLTELSGLNERSDALLRMESCDIKSLDTAALFNENRELVRGSIAVLAGYKASSLILTKVATKSSFKVAGKILAKTLAKLASKSGSAAAAGAAGIACGPLVWVCSPVLAITAWLAVDKIIVEIDESFSREGMKEEMMEALAEQKETLSTTLKEHYHHFIDSNVIALTQRIKPVDDIQ